MAARARDVDLVNGGIVRPLLVLSAPIVLSQLLQVAYNLVNTYWVGHIGPDAVSAISFSFPIIFLIISMAAGFSVAGTVLVAQNKGAGNHREVDHAAGQTIAFTLLASIVLSVVGWFVSPSLMQLIGAPAGTRILSWAVDYTRITFAGLFFMFGFFMFQALLRGWGDTRTPLYLAGLSVGLNVILDPFLIYGFTGNALLEMLGLQGLEASLLHLTGFTGMGVAGAALATIASRAVGAVVGIAMLFGGRVGIHIGWEDLRLKMDTVERIVRLGVPASMDTGTRAIGVIGLTAIVALMGSDAVAAFGIGNRLNSLVFLPAMGFASGISTMTGQNLGAGRPDRVKRAVGSGAMIAGGILALASVLVWLFAEPLVGFFLAAGGPQTAKVVAIGASYLRIVGPTFLFIGVFQTVLGAFRGSGNTQTAMGFSMLALWVFRIPTAYVLSQVLGWGTNGIWYGVAFSNVAAATCAALWFLRGTWTEALVETGEPEPLPVAARAAVDPTEFAGDGE